jgi:hypothetical protein
LVVRDRLLKGNPFDKSPLPKTHQKHVPLTE